MSNTQGVELHLLIHLINERGFKSAAEIGVEGCNLAKRALQLCPSLEAYYAVDPWKVYIESYHRPPHAKERDQGWWDSLYERALIVQKEFPKLEVMRMSSVVAAEKFDDYQLDIVYIDAVHDLVNIINDIYAWLPKIRNGGIICGHDYIAAFKEMATGVDMIFQDDLQLLIKNPDIPALSYKNTDQGGNWWVDINHENRGVYMDRVENEFDYLLGKVE